jgi:hypothetical protein
VSNSCVQAVLVGEAEDGGGILELERSQHLFHLRRECDRSACQAMNVCLRAWVVDAQREPPSNVLCGERSGSWVLGAWSGIEKTSRTFFSLVLSRRIDSCPIASGNTTDGARELPGAATGP